MRVEAPAARMIAPGSDALAIDTFEILSLPTVSSSLTHCYYGFESLLLRSISRKRERGLTRQRNRKTFPPRHRGTFSAADCCWMKTSTNSFSTLVRAASVDMKAIVFSICMIAGVSDESSAAIQNERGARNVKFAHRQGAVATRQLHVEPKHEVRGAIPRAIRGGNPLEMLNPFAPAKYGTAEDDTILDPQQPNRAEGIKFFSVNF
jgi:hypothetical protein